MKTKKLILLISIVLLITLLIFKLISNWMNDVMEGKPVGQYISSASIKEAKKEFVWIKTFQPTKTKYFSDSKQYSYSIKEVWIESNENNKGTHWYESQFKNILSLYFKNITGNDLHKFRLIDNEEYTLNHTNQIEHPNAEPRVRFLLNDIKDTINIEVIERNPNDSLNWLTEKVIDTIILINKY